MFPTHESLLLNTTLSKKNSASFYWPRGIFTVLFLYPCADQPAFHPQTWQSCDILPLISFTSLPEFPWTSLRNLSPLGFRWPSGVYHSQWGVPTPATPAGFEQGPKWKPLIFLNETETKNLDYNHRSRTIIGSTLLYLSLYIFFIRSLFSFDHLPLQLQWYRTKTLNIHHPAGGGVASRSFSNSACSLSACCFREALGMKFQPSFRLRFLAPRIEQRSDERIWNILKNSAGVFMNLEEEKGAIQIYLSGKPARDDWLAQFMRYLLHSYINCHIL